MNWKALLTIVAIIMAFSCNQDEKQGPSFLPQIVEARGYVVPKDSVAAPKVVPAGTPRVLKAGKPKVVPTYTNVHPSGMPKVVTAGTPKVCTPGKDSFSLPKVVTAIDSPFMAGIPEVVIAKEAYTKEQNPQSFSSFGKLQGLNSSYINCLLEDRSGNLWIGTNGGGVTKYDGKTFTHFTEKEGLGNNFTTSILQDKHGNLWFSTWGGGVSKYDGKSFTRFTQKEGLSNNFIRSILEDKSGNLWFGTEGGGINKYNGKSFTHFTEREGLVNNGVNYILEDKGDNLWISTGGGVSKYDGKSFINFTEKEGLSSNKIFSILQDKHGNLWFSTGGRGVSKYDGKNFTYFTENEGLSNNTVTSILEDSNGSLWLGTGNGVTKYDGKSFIHFTEREGLGNNFVRSILQDKTGNLWFGTNGGGVSKYNSQNFTHFTEKEGLSNNIVASILEDKSGNLWFGTSQNGVNKYDGKTFTHLTEDEGLINKSIWSMLEDKSGNFWFGSYEGVSKYDGKSFTNYTDKEGLINNDVKCIYEDRSGSLWFGTAGGVSKYDGKNFTNYTDKEGLSINNVMSMLEDKSGNLWFCGYNGGVSKYDGKNFTHFAKKEGLSHNNVRSILEDRRGNLWFGTLGGGINKYDGKSFIHFTLKEGLSDDNVLNMLEDKSGNLWFGTASGLSKLNRDKIALLTDSSVWSNSKSLFKTYTYDDGFLGIGVNAGNTIYEAKDGTIWIGASDRLTAFHPDAETSDTIPPNIQLTGLTLFNENIPWQNVTSNRDTAIVLNNGVRLNNLRFDDVNKWYSVPEHLSLPYNNNYLTFQFVGITLHSPKKVKYQYKLEGFDQNWSALTNHSEATYGNLSHGDYTFKVKAVNSDGHWSKEFSYPFTIRPPWWHTWWAYTLYGLLFLAGVVTVHRYQRKRLIQKERERKRQIEITHAKEIEKAYAELKATQQQLIHREKMASLGELTAGIAHEIQNPLNFVNNFSEVNKELIVEMKEEIDKGNLEEVRVIATDIEDNELKINHHGKRADAIVKGMLEHSRASTGRKEPTDINALADEYLRLSYHGLRAKDKDFNATIETSFDESIGKIDIVAQDIGRVMLNLYNNAFYAASLPSKGGIENAVVNRNPTVWVSTKRENDKIVIRVRDNGPGVSEKIVDKIFQPFFTTKPTGQGTGLGLSLSYDIIKAHAGEIRVNSTESEGTEFLIILPI